MNPESDPLAKRDSSPLRRAVVLWTGGKDSCLALHLARERGDVEIVALVTFVPDSKGETAEFKAHPQSEMRRQARRLGLPIHFVDIEPPYEASYAEGLAWIRDELKAVVVITGDIDLINGMPNWIEARCAGVGIEVDRPLWLKPRAWIMEQLFKRGIKARFSYLASPVLPKEWLNRVIDETIVGELQKLAFSSNIDVAGENGEYHTMVIDAPAFVFAEG